MKNINSFLAILCILILSSCNFGSNRKSIKVEKTLNKFRFEASYPEHKTKKVVAFIEQTLKEDNLFKTSESVKDSQINLGDSIKFYLKSNPGYIEVEFVKNNNSETAFHKLENMCMGIKEQL